MSRRARNRIDKRATALDLARQFGHGTPMPEADTDSTEPEDWLDTPPVNERVQASAANGKFSARGHPTKEEA